MSVRTHSGQFVGSGEGEDLQAEPISEGQKEAYQPASSQHNDRTLPSSVTSINFGSSASDIPSDDLPKSLHSNEDPATLRYDLGLHRAPPTFNSEELESSMLEISDHGAASLAQMQQQQQRRPQETKGVHKQTLRGMTPTPVVHSAPAQLAPGQLIPKAPTAVTKLAPVMTLTAPTSGKATAGQTSSDYHQNPADYAKPLRASMPGPESQHYGLQQQQRLQPQQQHGVHNNSPTTQTPNQPRGGRRGQRSSSQQPPAYDDVVRQTRGRGHQDKVVSPINLSPGSPDNAMIQDMLNRAPPSANINMNFINVINPNFGPGNPVNIGSGTQDTHYKGNTLASGVEMGQRPSGQERSPEPGYHHRYRGATEADMRSKGSWAASELPRKPGMDDDPDVIIEEDYEERFEDGVYDDNMDGPPSDSMAFTNSLEHQPEATPANQKEFSTQQTSDQSINQMKQIHSNQSNYEVQPTSNQSDVGYSDASANQEMVYSNQPAAATPEPSTNQGMVPIHSSQAGAAIHAGNESLTNLNASDSSQTASGPMTLGNGLFNFKNVEASLPSLEPSTKPKRPLLTFDQSERTPPSAATNQTTPNVSDQSGATSPAGTAANRREDTQILNQLPKIVQAKTLKLRDYQLELADPAIQGINIIIIAPAGSGKSSHIATLICQEHLKKPQEISTITGNMTKTAKIAFIVPTVVLVEQVNETLEEYLQDCKIGKRSGADTCKQSLKSLMRCSDIVVLTPTILVNGLAERKVVLTDFSLLVFDECHRAIKDSPYSQIMEVYLKLQRARNGPLVKLPQIIGLTASPSIGGNTDDEKARDCIMEMCANMDTHLIQTVQQHTTELQEHSHTPVKEVKVVDKRQQDPFRDRVVGMMQSIECLFNKGQPLSICRGQQRYRSSVEEIYREKGLQDRRNDIKKCCEHLFEYNKVLQILDLVRMQDAFQELEEFQKKLHRPQDDVDNFLRDLYQKNVSDLYELCKLEATFPNPKMATLKQGILKECRRCSESGKEFRCMVFVVQRLLTAAIQDWMQRDKELSALQPGILTGSRANVDEGGMTKSQQDVVITEFRSGSRKILISTSIGIEGLNIPACNMVISYSYTMDEVKMIQFRGRARAADSVEMSLGSRESATKYEMNLAVITAMECAIKDIQRMSEKDFYKEVTDKQQDVLVKKEDEEEKKEKRKQENASDDVRLLCRGCEKFACNASDIRCSGCNHINPDETFKYYKLDIRPHTDPKKNEKGIKKIYCKNCGKDWGNTFRGHPCLKIESFTCETKDGQRTFKKWKQVNFPIEDYRR